MKQGRWATFLGIVTLACLHLTVAALCLAFSYAASWNDAGIVPLWADALSWFGGLLLHPALLWSHATLPTLGDIPLWDGVARDYFGGVVDLPIIFANSLLWATLAWNLVDHWARVRRLVAGLLHPLRWA